MPKRRDTVPPPRPSTPRRRAPQKSEPATFPTLEPFGRRVESLRLERGFTQRTLAQRAKISTTYLQDIAYARANPTISVALNLANALGVSVVDLFESPSSPVDDLRVVLVADLEELAAVNRRLTSLAKRLMKARTDSAGRGSRTWPDR